MADGMIPNPDHDTLYTDDPYELRCAVHPQFDAVFVDVPTGKDDSPWLDIDFHTSLKRLLNPESVVVVNSGSAPSMDWPYDTAGAEYPGRDKFVRRTGRHANKGGLGYFVISVYDEVSKRQESLCRIYPFVARFVLHFVIHHNLRVSSYFASFHLAPCGSPGYSLCHLFQWGL
jgi:hypothetical protein